MYDIEVWYCVPNPLRKFRALKIMEAACYELITLCPEDETCTGSEVPYYTITFYGEACQTIAPLGCVWIRALGDGYSGACELLDYGCECVLEYNETTGQINCALVEQICADPAVTGPPGCPNLQLRQTETRVP